MLSTLRAWRPALLLGDQAFDHRAFGQAAPVMLLEHAEMDEDVALGVVADDEAEAARGVEPFDGAGEPDERFVVRLVARLSWLSASEAGPSERASRRDVIYARSTLDQTVKLP